MFKLILAYLIGLLIGAILWEAAIRTIKFTFKTKKKAEEKAQ